MPVVGMAGSADFCNYSLPVGRDVTAASLAKAQKQGPVLAGAASPATWSTS